MSGNKKTFQKKWKEGVKGEVVGWQGWVSNNGVKYQVSRPLSEKLVPLIGKKRKVKIADIGSGPISLIGNYLKGTEIEIFPSDILADYYLEILKNLNLTPANGLVEKQDMTKLTYDSNFFDIVHCSNALDHCLDPFKALKEMIRVCKPGGWIYIFHIAHEGQRNKYKNLHLWNLDMTEDGNCIVWNNKDTTKTDTFLLSEVYPFFKTTLQSTRKAAFVTSIAQKK